MNVFGERHLEYRGAGVLAPLRVGRRTSAHRNPVALPVALKRNVALWCFELIRSKTSRVFGAGTFPLAGEERTTAVALEVAGLPAPETLLAASCTVIV